MSKDDLLTELKRELGPSLKTHEQVAPPPGLPTGWSKLDRYLLWNGLPKSALSLMISEAGGATSLWVRSAARVTAAGQWVAWIDEGETRLMPWVLRRQGVELNRLVCVSQPRDEKQTLWALQELMSLCLFELIACDLGDRILRDGQVLKLKRLAMRYQTALVFITRNTRVRQSPFYALILQFQKEHVRVNRALHRPSPFILERRDLYADTLPLLAAGRRALCG